MQKHKYLEVVVKYDTRGTVFSYIPPLVILDMKLYHDIIK